MGRRPSGALPVMRHHKPTNTARIVFRGKVFSLGRWGSHEAQDRCDALMAAFIASGRTSLDAGMAVIGRPTVPVPPRLTCRPPRRRGPPMQLGPRGCVQHPARYATERCAPLAKSSEENSKE